MSGFYQIMQKYNLGKHEAAACRLIKVDSDFHLGFRYQAAHKICGSMQKIIEGRKK